jgi:hypothetical protein
MKGIPVTKQNPVAGMVWFRLEDYEAAIGIMEDRDKFPATYSAWRIKAEQAEKQMQRLGWSTTRAYINAADFGAWCRVRELNLNAEARNQFANSVALDAARSME